MAAFEAVQECIWLRMLLLTLCFSKEGMTMILCDDNSAINLSEDPLLHVQVKHIDIKYHFLCKHVASNEINLRYINTKDNIADIFTKALTQLSFTRLCMMMGLTR